MIKTIVSTELPVNERYLIRKNIISHGDGKRRVCIVTGTHGDELEGQMVCYLMARQLQEQIEHLDGTVEIYPSLNPLGIDTIQRGIPNFDLDMNRIFPGDKNGTMAEQAAYTIIEDLKGADLVIDVHSSNLYLRETPQVRINVLNENELVPLARQLGVDFIWVHDAATVLEAETSGVFITEYRTGMVVSKHQELGQIVEPLTGKILSRVVSPVDGYLFTIRAYPIVYEGSLMARIYHE